MVQWKRSGVGQAGRRQPCPVKPTVATDEKQRSVISPFAFERECYRPDLARRGCVHDVPCAGTGIRVQVSEGNNARRVRPGEPPRAPAGTVQSALNHRR